MIVEEQGGKEEGGSELSSDQSLSHARTISLRIPDHCLLSDSNVAMRP